MITDSQRNEAAEEYAALKQKQSIGNFTDEDLYIMRFAHMAGQSYAAEQFQPKWISVGEMLPENRTEVLCLTNRKDLSVLEFKHGCFFDGLTRILNVRAWHILPQLPNQFHPMNISVVNPLDQ